MPTDPPFYSDYINAQTQALLDPSEIHLKDNKTYMYFVRHLLQKAVGVFSWRKPEHWADTLFLYCLYCYGVVAVVNTDLYGVIPQPCTLGGYTVQYQPAYAMVQNPLISNGGPLIINRDCAIIRLTPDYGGIQDIINYYAARMALTVATHDMNVINSRLSYVFGVPRDSNKKNSDTTKTGNRKRNAATLKSVYDDILSGSPASFMDADLIGPDGKPSWIMFNQDVRGSFIAPELLENIRKLECEFASAVGIPANLATAKKERTISAEVTANDTETAVAPSLWLDTIRKDLSVVNGLFGLDMGVDWRYRPNVK